MANPVGHEHQHASYASLYSDETHDVWGGDYGPYYAQFRRNIMNQGNGTNDLNTATWNRTNTPHAYAAHYYVSPEGGGNPEPRVYCIHHPMRYAPPMGVPGVETKMILMGDAYDNLPPPVILWQQEQDNHFFRASPNVRIPTPETIDAAISNDPDIMHFGPYPNEEAGTELTRVRRLVFLSPPVASLLLAHGEYMTAKEFWHIIVGHIRSLGDDAAEVHKSVIEYGQALLTLCVEPANPPNYPVMLEGHRCIPIMDDPVIPILDRATRLFVKNLIASHLPGLFREQQPTAANTPTVEAINRLAEEFTYNQNRAEERSREESAKTPTKYWGDMTIILNRITHTVTANELPILYHKVAASNKRTERAVVQEVLYTYALQYNTSLGFPVTPQLVKKITGLQFLRIDMEDLSRGIHPFLTVPVVGTERSLVDRNLDAYDDLVQGNTGMQLNEAQQIRDVTSVVMPKTLIQAITALQDFRILLAALLGAQHAHTLAYIQFVNTLSGMVASHLEPLTQNISYLPSKILLWVTNRSATWFHNQYSAAPALDPPNYDELIQKIQLQDTWEPRIPTRHLPRATPTPQAPAPPRADPRNSLGGETGGRREHVTNPSVDPAFQGRTSSGITIGEARRRGEENNRPVPKTSNGTELCLSYHILGFCWTTCNRKTTHRSLSATEKTALKSWCDHCFTTSS